MPRNRGVRVHDITVRDGKGRVAVNAWMRCGVYCEDGTGRVGYGTYVNGLRNLMCQGMSGRWSLSSIICFKFFKEIITRVLLKCLQTCLMRAGSDRVSDRYLPPCGGK